MFFKNGLKVKLFNIDWTLVCWIVIFIVAVFMLFNTLKAFPNDINDVDVYYQNEYQFSMTYNEFSEILKASNQYLKLRESEENERVYIELQDDKWILVDSDNIENELKTDMKIIWMDENNKPIKTVTITATIKDVEIECDSRSFIRKIYCRISEIGFPIALILLVLL